jgi:hypothetical protein
MRYRSHNRSAIDGAMDDGGSIGRAMDNRAARANATCPVRTGGAGCGVGFGRLNGEQAQNKQARSNCLHHHPSPQRSVGLVHFAYIVGYELRLNARARTTTYARFDEPRTRLEMAQQRLQRGCRSVVFVLRTTLEG